MRVADILNTVAGIASIDEPLYVLLAEETIPNEDSRRLMKRQAFTAELEAGRVREGWGDVSEYRALRQFLTTAPTGVFLGEGVTLDERGRVIAYPSASLAPSFAVA